MIPTGPAVVAEYDGGDKRVMHLSDGTLLRYPKHATARELMRRERWVLGELAGKLTLRIPAIRYVGRDDAFDSCTFLPGKRLTYDFFRKRSAAEQETIAMQLGTFLHELHQAIDVEHAKRNGIVAPAWPMPSGQIRSALAGRLAGPEELFLEDVLERFAALVPSPRNERVLHNDIGGHNFSVDGRDGRLQGVFDFADVCVGDLHQDFQWLGAYDPTFVELVVARYEAAGEVDLSLEEVYLRHCVCMYSQAAWRPDDEKKRAWLEVTRRRYQRLL